MRDLTLAHGSGRTPISEATSVPKQWRVVKGVGVAGHLFLFWICLSFNCYAQSDRAELLLHIFDPTGRGIHVTVSVTSPVNNYSQTLETNTSGALALPSLPFGVYLVRIAQPGFVEVSQRIDLHSAIPMEERISLSVAPLATTLTVKDDNVLIDPYRASSAMQLGADEIQSRLSSLPGRSVQDLVNTQPGWLYEGNAVLHPRGSEYQTQFVVDGLPLTDNRSPGFGPEIEADDLESMRIYTAGFPAEYGRKMGGVIELNTLRKTDPGLHGQFVAYGGGYETAGSFARLQRQWASNTLGITAEGSRTSHYLNPVVPENFTNNGTTGDFSMRYERELRQSDRLALTVRHELSRYQIPNEFLQETAGQVQNRDNFETIGTVNYQSVLSGDILANATGMVRDSSNDLYSNLKSTPIFAVQHNSFTEGYFKAAVSVHHGSQEWRVGVDAESAILHEHFSDSITDSSYYDPGTPATFTFTGSRLDLEQAAFLQDQVRLGKWTVEAGLRWDHYQLMLNRQAFSPRISIGRYFPRMNSVLHLSYDRVFQSPDSENLLISSSSQVTSINPQVLRLPLEPSTGDYYEGGMTTGLRDHVRIDLNIFRRNTRNFADDDQLLNTGISYPISFQKAIVYGAEGKIELLNLAGFSGFSSYSYTLGNAWFPVTGGLFLGDSVTGATTQLTGHFPDSQDQRHTLRNRLRYQANCRLWLAVGMQFGSGLPFDYGGTQQQAVAQYGQKVIDQVNFARGRINPAVETNASMGSELYKHEKVGVHFQVDATNLGNRLNVINFGGLFSGNAIGPSRSYALRLTTRF